MGVISPYKMPKGVGHLVVILVLPVNAHICCFYYEMPKGVGALVAPADYNSVEAYMMPQGVEHNAGGTAPEWAAGFGVYKMPKGVEHFATIAVVIPFVAVATYKMSKGVEHMFKDGAIVGASYSAYIRCRRR